MAEEHAAGKRRKRIAICIVIFGALMAAGLYVSGAYHTIRGAGVFDEPQSELTAEVIGGKQVVRVEQYANGYRPNHITVRRGVPVEWIIDSKSPYTCAAYLVVPKLDIRKFLASGENTIRFTPEEAGEIPWSCTGELYSGVFTVIE